MRTSTQAYKVKKCVELVEKFSLTEEFALELLHADYSQWELPNQLNRVGQKSDLRDTFKRQQIGKNILLNQRYEIKSLIEQDETVVLEAIWTGKMRVDAGPLKSGQDLKAFFCMIFVFNNGKIHSVRNYDCFEPFA